MTTLAFDKLAIRETIEDYLNFLDAKNWEGIASCFSEDSKAWYNHEPQTLKGGQGVANFLRRIEAYGSTDHALSNLHIVVKGDTATCDSRLTASLHFGTEREGTISVRAIWYRDKLRRLGDRWVIYERHHEPQWQYDVPSRTPHLL